MKHIFLNLKRFDVPVEYGGVNRLAPPSDWGRAVVAGAQAGLAQYDPAEVEFVMYLPEAHIPAAVAAKAPGSPVQIGCQGIYREDTAPGGNFGAFTTNRPAAAAKALGCASAVLLIAGDGKGGDAGCEQHGQQHHNAFIPFHSATSVSAR